MFICHDFLQSQVGSELLFYQSASTRTPVSFDMLGPVLYVACIPVNFFWDISVRFLSWECWDFWRQHDHFQRFPKKSEVLRRRPKSLGHTRINASLLPVLFTSKIRDREEGIVIYSFYTWFSFLTWVWVNIFLEIVSNKMATTHIFQSGMRNWAASVSRREIEVFNPQVWDSRLRRESWQVYAWRISNSYWSYTVWLFVEKSFFGSTFFLVESI